MYCRATSRDLLRVKGQPSFPVGEDGDASLVRFASRDPRMGHRSAWMRSAATSTSVTPRKENKSFTRYLGGCSEVCFTIWPTASVTAAWNITPSACRPARFTRTSWPDWNITPARKDPPAATDQMQAVSDAGDALSRYWAMRIPGHPKRPCIGATTVAAWPGMQDR